MTEVRINFDMQVNASVWNMKEGKITALKHLDNIYHIQEIETGVKEIKLNPEILKGYVKRPIKQPYIVKWLRENKREVFTLKEFFDAHPKYAERPAKVNPFIAKLLTDKKIMQLGNDRFKVIGKI